MGDFNFSTIHWDGAWTCERDNDFKESIQDAYLIQKVEKPKSIRVNLASNILDLNFDSGL